MKLLMQTAVNRVYEILENKDDAEFKKDVLEFALTYARKWDEPGGS